MEVGPAEASVPPGELAEQRVVDTYSVLKACSALGTNRHCKARAMRGLRVDIKLQLRFILAEETSVVTSFLRLHSNCFEEDRSHMKSYISAFIANA